MSKQTSRKDAAASLEAFQAKLAEAKRKVETTKAMLEALRSSRPALGAPASQEAI